MNRIKEIAKQIQDAGGDLYLVGGAIRDGLLNRTIREEDYCVTGLTAQKFEGLFPEARLRGKTFPVYELEGKEFALARKERKQGNGHTGFKIETAENISIEEDLSRRDITINSMARHVLTETLVDPYGGKEDLIKRTIRATTDHFLEDPLRIYRVARLASVLAFSVEEQTMDMMKQGKEELAYLSEERVFMEMKKALASKKPSIFFEVLKKANVLGIHFQEIENLIGSLQPEKYHPEGDAFNHTMLALDKASTLTPKLEVRFSALVHDLGKGITPAEEYPHHYQHEVSGVKLVEKFGERLKIPSLWTDCGKTACFEHMRGGIFERMKPTKKVEFIERVSKSRLGLTGLQIVVRADKESSGNRAGKHIYFEEIGKKCLQEVTGREVLKKYPMKKGIDFKNQLYQERVKWMRKQNV